MRFDTIINDINGWAFKLHRPLFHDLICSVGRSNHRRHEMPPARCEQVLQVSGVPLSLSQLFLGSFCLIPILRLLVSTWVCPAAYKSCTGEQQAEHWQVRSDAWTSSCPLGDGRQTDRQKHPMAGSLSGPAEGLRAVVITAWDACFVRGCTDAEYSQTVLIVWDLLFQC